MEPQAASRRRNPFVAVATVCALALAPALSAQPVDPTLELRADLFQANFDSSVRFDSLDLGLGTSLDLEEDLGVEDSADVLRAELALRTGRRSRLTIDYVTFDREGSAVVGRQFRFGDFVFRADAEVSSSTETRFAALGWRYALVKNATSEFGLSLSAAWVEISASVTGQVVVNGFPTLPVSESGDAEGPVPMLGLHGAWWLGDRFRLSAAGRYLEIEDLDGWTGSALDLSARFDWFFLDQLGVGVGWSSTELEAENLDPEDDGLTRADSSFDGLRVGLTLAL